MWSAGISGFLGAEWFFTKNMSLSAEYDILANIEWGVLDYIQGNSYYNNQNKIINEETRTGHNPGDFKFSANNVEFGLSFYFL